MDAPYLFAEEATIHDVVKLQRHSLHRVLEDIPVQEIFTRSLEELVAEIVERFRLDVPVLDRSRIGELPREEVEIDVSNDPRRDCRGPGPHVVKGTAFRIAVPFKGEAELFKYATSPYDNAIRGEIQDQAVVLTHAAEHPDTTEVRNDFDYRLTQIESLLQGVQAHADEWNRQLPELVRSRLSQRRARLERDQALTLGYPPTPRKAAAVPANRACPHGPNHQYDLFLSHASEDKDAIARPLYTALVAAGVSVWFDEAVLELGDSLRRKIDEGLARCRYGVVILSPRFLAKQWPQRELDGLVARKTASGEMAILPIWYELQLDDVMRYSPPLADRLAGRSDEGITTLVNKILRVLSSTLSIGEDFESRATGR